MSQINKREHHKVVLLGASGVGKSSIALRYVRNTFFEYNESTIGAAFLSMPVSYEGREISLDIWDTAGQERYSSLAPMYYRGASTAIIVYDITSVETLNQAKRWIREVRSSIDNCPIVLVGNKLDLETLRKVTTQSVAEYTLDQDIDHIESSAKSSNGIQDIFKKVITRLPPPRAAPTTAADLNNENPQIKKSCRCYN